MTFPNRLKQIRAERKETQAHAAKKIGITACQLYEYENDKREPRMTILIAIADYYGVTLDYLVGGEDK